MTTEVCRVHILWIFRITTITPAKPPIQNCLRGGFRERVGIKNFTLLMKNQQGFSLNCINYSLDICTDIQKLKNM